ncbi:MAG: DNA-processing protein DprA [Anaerovoracaceae bacterium]|nr:DNA-processing protein DprA [Bacillota bacterium]MDY2671309.1 DNA-processing protein DprA [Anaerovoracaceae bacterium]
MSGINMENAAEHVVEVKRGSGPYPMMLNEIGDGAPESLYCIGDISLLNMRCAAVVGARKASQYGKWAAFNLGRKLAESGIVTVSGMAYGCDAEAHKGALSVDGRTIAVLGGGPDICYPARNRKLYNEILEKDGLIVSEWKPGTEARRAYFALRNRIISGLSLVTCVTEAGLSSGTLITAEYAADQGRTVMAVPYNISNVKGIGCNKLIQDGASIIVSFADVLEELGVTSGPDAADNMTGLGHDEKELLELIKTEGEISLNYAALKTGRKISDLNSTAALLEIKGFVVNSMGKLYIAK